MNARYLILSLVVGVLAGLFGSAFHVSADWALAVHTRVDGPFWLRMAISMSASAAMLVVALMLTRRFAPEAGGSGVPEVEGAVDDRLPLRWLRILPVKFVGGVLSIGSGAVLGREGPTIHIGAALAEGVAEHTKMAAHERRGMLAAGAAAGLAAAFNAPLASVLFVMEETRREFPYHFHTFSGVVIASVCSAVVTELLLGGGPYLPIEAVAQSKSFLVMATVLGALLGVLGYVFNTALLATVSWLQPGGRPVSLLVAAAIGAVLGGLLVFNPSAVEGGEGLIAQLVVNADALTFLMGLVLLRFVMTMMSYGLGAPGGLFAPLLALAVCAGLCVASVVNALPFGFDVSPQTTAVVAMAGLFASTVRAPLVGVVLTAELTGAYDLFLPLLICAGMAHIVAQALGGRPIYTQLLERRLALAVERRSPDVAG